LGPEAALSGKVAPYGAQGRLLVTAVGGARGAEALSAALAVCAADDRRASLWVELGSEVRTRRPTLLASPAARRIEDLLAGLGATAAARGLICHLAAGQGTEGLDRVAEAIDGVRDCAAYVVLVDPALWIDALEHPRLRAQAALVRAELPRDRSLAALAVRDLRSRGMPVRVATRALGWASARRALAGLRVGVAEDARLRRWAAVLLGCTPGRRAVGGPEASA
jgi:hypothetical protein